MLELLPVHELAIVGCRRPAREPSDVHKRLILPATLDLRLDVELERFDMGRLAFQPDALEAMEELETNAALLEHLVEWGEHDVPHASPHSPEAGTPTREE